MINIDDLLGVRYRENGRNPKYGLDCLGCAIEVERRFGHIVPDIPEAKVPRHKKNYVFIREEIINKSPVEQIDFPRNEGDIILFKSSLTLNHIGVYLGEDHFIHCDRFGVHLENINEHKDKIGRVYTWL